MVKNPSLRELKKTLGNNYSIRNIDWENCLYRDFGNGFNVEISGCSRANRKGSATLYLWFGDETSSCLIVKTVSGVGRSAAEIHDAAENLLDYSNGLLAQEYDTREKLFYLKNPELKPERLKKQEA